jgi:inositol phosphorylceramide mannosyltransferase catalytic subunit
MRRSLLVFIFCIVLLLLFALHSVSTLLSLLIEDASADAIPLSDLPEPSSPLPPSYPQRIPKIIHQTYINESIPQRWQAAQQSCIDLHVPDYEYILWTDAKSHDFIAQHYEWFLPTFEGYAHPIQRADAIRYFVLAHYGGVYIDLDDGCARRLDPLLAYQAFVRRTVPTGISNDVMGAVPNHPFFVRVTESLQGADRGWVLPYITIMASTGPLFLSVVWKKWMGEHAALQEVEEDWEGRVRVLMPQEYDKFPWSFFKTYKGDSWHGEDAKLIFWMGKNWMLLTAVGFLVAGVLGVAVWWIYSRLLGMGKRRNGLRSRSRSPARVLFAPFGQRIPLWRTWMGGSKADYELVEQHDA